MEVSAAVRHIYIYISLGFKRLMDELKMVLMKRNIDPSYFIDRASRHKFLLMTKFPQFFIYLFISSLYMFIIRRSNCINT